MTVGIKCDRCGANVNCINVTKIRIGEYYGAYICFDLCPNCNKELAKWLNEKQGEDNK